MNFENSPEKARRHEKSALPVAGQPRPTRQNPSRSESKMTKSSKSDERRKLIRLRNDSTLQRNDSSPTHHAKKFAAPHAKNLGPRGSGLQARPSRVEVMWPFGPRPKMAGYLDPHHKGLRAPQTIAGRGVLTIFGPRPHSAAQNGYKPRPVRVWVTTQTLADRGPDQKWPFMGHF